jgi:peroxiredoxin
MVERERKINSGDIAPDFVLKDQNSKDFKLSGQPGKRILLSFHPLAWTDVCSKQMQSLEHNYNTFELLKTIPTGLSVDSVPCKKAWAEHLKINKTQLLADFWPHGGVAIRYDLFRENNGFSERANVLIDDKGKVIFFKTYPLGQLPDINEVIDFIKQLK